MEIFLLSVMPQLCVQALAHGIVGRAIRNSICNVNYIDLKEYASKKRVDDSMYGGGGMLLRYEPISLAIESAIQKSKYPYKIIYMSPWGYPLTMSCIKNYVASSQSLIIICGRYQGIDQRIIDQYQVEHISIGDIIVSGGELPACLFIDAMIRLLPCSINPSSLQEESFEDNLLCASNYTKPAITIQGNKVPKELLSGNHKLIKQWRYQSRINNTKNYRPDLWKTVEQQLDKKITLSIKKTENETNSNH